ncbi:MAG: DUF4915 domain-containing protein [Desulfomicrobium sp.]|nr:DUF4915 domain-containing protein [Pseudomonadota bacterium]MBV1713013.1 DUF4915 domain-containing protein [Desulfomicrobium sp.]MBU4571983.1 DUF4915 domain-containing protein [Pseudomonadota bacterium]MBU4596132.1 DUF4915 domain-containing protein [Pseudomonadota bacterium]MBV1721436.1 DUF4915 domain-containing protein [Desulfomicrobium sp.]
MVDRSQALIVSAPNDGGVFVVHSSNIYQLDDLSSTGLAFGSAAAYRAVQPDSVFKYGAGNSWKHIDKELVADIHDVLVVGESIYIVGTERNAIYEFDADGREIRRWEFGGEEDSKHINCLEMWNGRVVFSAFGDFKTHREYKNGTFETGFVADLLTGECLIGALSQPHSLRSHGEGLLLANSELGEIREYDGYGMLVRSKYLGGYTRGIAFDTDRLYVGLSCSRNVESTAKSMAVVLVLDRVKWEEISRIEMPCPEIYDIKCIDDLSLAFAVIAEISHGLCVKYRDLLKNGSCLFAVDKKVLNVIETQERQISVALEMLENERKASHSLIRALDTQVRQNEELQQRLLDVLESSSWRFTAPLREIFSFFSRKR